MAKKKKKTHLIIVPKLLIKKKKKLNGVFPLGKLMFEMSNCEVM